MDTLEKLNNVVVKNLNEEHGKRVIEAFDKLGVDTSDNEGIYHEAGGNACIYYGIIDGYFTFNSIECVQEHNARIITLEELEAMIPKEEPKESKYFGGASPDHDMDKLSWSNDGAIEAAIMLLKSNGYKVLKPTTNWEEI